MTREIHTGHHGHDDGEVFVREWSDKNTFNSFNNWKGLLYSAWYEDIAKDKIPVPIQARIDPTLKCPLSCEWCNSARYRKNGHELSEKHILNVLEFLSKWGVKSVVWAGGGEPTYHPRFFELLERNAELGMDAAILSNGVIHNPRIAEQIGQLCRWAGISVDAGTEDTYVKLKGCATFGLVIKNIRIMVENSINCNVGFKFLISPSNQHELYQACEIARDIGATDFIARPMDMQHQGMTNTKFSIEDFDVDLILSEFEKCHELESDDFHVYTVVHKFDRNLGHSKRFKQCYGAPLRIHIATDGNTYFCDDQYYQEYYKLGAHYPDPTNILSFWGGIKHKALLYGDTPKRCKTRCCVADYCIQCERLFVDKSDPMCMRYP